MRTHAGLSTRNRLLTGVVLAVTVAATAAVLPVAAASAAPRATPVTITAAQEQDIRARMTDGGIAVSVQNSLIAGLRAGRVPDALTSAAPVRTVTQKIAGGVRTISVFADGSRSWIDQQTPQAAPTGGVSTQAAGLSNCVLSGGWYVGCRVSVADIVSSAGFVIDLKTSTANLAQVREFRGKWCTNSVGACTVSGGIVRGTQSSAGPAWARLNYTANIFGGPSVAAEIGVRVSGTRITTY